MNVILTYRNLLLFCACIWLHTTYGQETKIDSLRQITGSTRHDSIKIMAFIEWDKLIYLSDPAKDAEITKSIEEICLNNLKKTKIHSKEKKFFQSNLAWAFNSLGILEFNAGNGALAIQYYNKAIRVNQSLKNTSAIASLYNNIGNVYEKNGNYPLALRYHFKSLTLREQLKDENGIAQSWCNIGLTQINQGNFKDAIDNLQKSIQIMGKSGSPEIAAVFGNLGIAYEKKHNYAKALENYLLGLEKAIAYNNIGQQANAYNNIGNCYMYMAEFKNALMHYEKAFAIFELYNEPVGMSAGYNNMGTAQFYLKDFVKARDLQQKALALSTKCKFKEVTQNSYLGLSRIDSAVHDFRSAFENYKAYIACRDSLVNEANTKKSVQTQLQYEFDKKEAATKAAQEKKDAISRAEKERQQMILVLVAGVLVLVFVFAVFIFRSLRRTKKQKQIIEEQKKEVELQKHLVEEKQKEILDSIRYAKRIQLALLPSEKYLERKIKW